MVRDRWGYGLIIKYTLIISVQYEDYVFDNQGLNTCYLFPGHLPGRGAGPCKSH